MLKSDIKRANEIIHRRDSGPELREMLGTGRLTGCFFRKKIEQDMLHSRYDVTKHLSKIAEISEMETAKGLGEKLARLLEMEIKKGNAENSIKHAHLLEDLVWAYHLEGLFDNMRQLKNRAFELRKTLPGSAQK